MLKCSSYPKKIKGKFVFMLDVNLVNSLVDTFSKIKGLGKV